MIPDDAPLAVLTRGVGVVSLVLAAVGLVRPRALAAVAGVQVAEQDAALPLLVRLASARQASVGLALLTRRPTEVGRAAGLFLPLTALDAAAVLAARRSGVLARRSVAASLTVLAVNVAVAVRARGR